jgi:four helix bundle protein
MDKISNKYNLEDRTTRFGEEIIIFCSSLKQDAVSKPLISQLVRSGTSIGANYAEANGGSSRRDFQNKIYICKKEAQETLHWLRIIQKYFSDKELQVRELSQEVSEHILIFGKILSSLKKSEGNKY